MDKFLNTCSVTRLNHEKTGYLSRTVVGRDWISDKYFPSRKSPAPDGFNVAFYQALAEVLIPLLLKLFHKVQAKGTLPNMQWYQRHSDSKLGQDKNTKLQDNILEEHRRKNVQQCQQTESNRTLKTLLSRSNGVHLRDARRVQHTWLNEHDTWGQYCGEQVKSPLTTPAFRIRVLVWVADALLLVQHPAHAPGSWRKTARVLGPCCPCRSPGQSSWLLLQPRPVLAAAAIWGGNQWVEDISLAFSLSLVLWCYIFQISKQINK